MKKKYIYIYIPDLIVLFCLNRIIRNINITDTSAKIYPIIFIIISIAVNRFNL